MRDPGPLLASGRDAEIFECGPHLVLRRSRDGRSIADEARIMEHVRLCGYPVPAIDEVSDDGTCVVMERIEGNEMVRGIARRPWTVTQMGHVIADLHRRLHELPAPVWLPPAPMGSGDRILHLDLHPLNVILSPRGPIVIDWTNACRGDPSDDVAVTWTLIEAGEIPESGVIRFVAGFLRTSLVRSFLNEVDRGAARRRIPEVVAWKTLDPHMSASERARMAALAERATQVPEDKA